MSFAMCGMMPGIQRSVGLLSWFICARDDQSVTKHTNKVMATLWLTLATALIAAASALAGVVLNSYLSRRDKALELSFRAAQESKDFLISRGEDLYIHLDEMDAFVSAHCRLIGQFCNAHIGFDDFRRLRREAWEDREKFSLSRIKLTIRSFFPELEALHLELAANLNHLNTIDRALLDVTSHDAKLLYRVNADAVRLQKLVATKGELLRNALARHLSQTFSSKTQNPGIIGDVSSAVQS